MRLTALKRRGTDRSALGTSPRETERWAEEEDAEFQPRIEQVMNSHMTKP
jgi:hypothetical protein